LPVDVGSVRYAHLANINFTYETIIIHDGSQYTRAQSQILKSLLPQFLFEASCYDLSTNVHYLQSGTAGQVH
ncbi:MAG: hypothetical protein ACYSW7_02145, partial [Planctomycetota bacterium]